MLVKSLFLCVRDKTLRHALEQQIMTHSYYRIMSVEGKWLYTKGSFQTYVHTPCHKHSFYSPNFYVPSVIQKILTSREATHATFSALYPHMSLIIELKTNSRCGL